MSNRERIEVPTPAFNLADQAGLFVRGVTMGMADVVPGVSGGTIAFISGIYERFIEALRSLSLGFLAPLVKGDVRGAWARLMRIHWAVLLPVGLGVGLAVVTMSKVITSLMVDRPGPTYAFFFGLILASAWVPIGHMRQKRLQHLAIGLLAAVGAYAFVGLQGGGIEFRVASEEAGARTVFYGGKLRDPGDLAKVQAFAGGGQGVAVFDEKDVLRKGGVTAQIGVTVFHEKQALYDWLGEEPALVVLEEQRAPLWWLFCCGLLAISAMVLPGLSGSFLLLFLGQYHAVFSAIHQTIGHVLGLLGRAPDPVSALTAHAWLQDVAFVGVFGLGVLAGLVIFSRVVSWLFAHAHDLTMGALTGIMVGALRQPAQVVLGATGDGGTSWGVVVGIAVLGAAVVTGLNVADTWFRRRRAEA